MALADRRPRLRDRDRPDRAQRPGREPARERHGPQRVPRDRIGRDGRSEPSDARAGRTAARTRPSRRGRSRTARTLGRGRRDRRRLGRNRGHWLPRRERTTAAPAPVPAAGWVSTRSAVAPMDRAARRAPIATARPGRVISPPNARLRGGLRPRREPPARSSPQDGALAIFGFGERVPDGSYPGVISVIVGTPRAGRTDPARRPDPVRVRHDARRAGRELFRRRGPGSGRPQRTSAWTAALGLLLDFDATEPGAPTRSVALLAQGNRAFVIESIGFDEMFPGLAQRGERGPRAVPRGLPVHGPAPRVERARVPGPCRPTGMEGERGPADAAIFTDRTSANRCHARDLRRGLGPRARGRAAAAHQVAVRQDNWVSAGSCGARRGQLCVVTPRPGRVQDAGPRGRHRRRARRAGRRADRGLRGSRRSCLRLLVGKPARGLPGRGVRAHSSRRSNSSGSRQTGASGCPAGFLRLLVEDVPVRDAVRPRGSRCSCRRGPSCRGRAAPAA